MTTPPTTTMPTGDDLLIQEAIRHRRLHRSGRSLGGALVLAVFFGAAGYLLALHPGVIIYSMPYPSGFPLRTVLVICGILAFLVAVLFLADAVSGARPCAPWGDPVSGDCPVCGEQALRQDGILLREGRTLKTAASGTVTLCESPCCPYAAVQ
ncbi:MAG TPA: hypothetical protein VI365_25230 [Trebonia sp.]